MYLFVVGILLVIAGFTMALIGFITERTTWKRLAEKCTAVADGTYAGCELVRVSTSNTVTYNLATFEVDGRTVTSRMRDSRGIGMRAQIGMPLVVHYDPNDPSFCWGGAVGSADGRPPSIRVLKLGGVIALVVGVAIIVIDLLIAIL